jgi:hypothetical protein
MTEDDLRNLLTRYNNGLATTDEVVSAVQKDLEEMNTLFVQASEQTEAALDDWAEARQTINDIEFVWGWRANQGMKFIVNLEDARTVRSLLDGTKLEDLAGWEWVAEARERYAEDEEEDTDA